MNSNLTGKEILVRKASGEEVPFELIKLEKSLYNAGAGKEIVRKITTDISSWIRSGVTTRQIYSRAFNHLHKERNSSSAKYLLKEAILELGPTGYPFEKFIGHLFEKQGFQIEVGVVVDGTCITHEMDVVATKGEVQNLVECKYRKDQGKQISVQVPLYVRSRVNDIIEHRLKLPEYQNLEFVGWVVTNTRFSPDSMKYGEHSGLRLMSWDYPKGSSLKENIENLKVYPITVLHHLSKEDKQFLLKQGIVTCSELFKNKRVLKDLKIDHKKYQELLNDLNQLV